MRYLEKAFKFTFKNFILFLPLLISIAIPALVMSVGSMGFLLRMRNIEELQRLMRDFAYNSNNISAIPNLFNNLYGPTMLASMGIAGLLSIVFAIIVKPATYGLVNKKYETGSASLSDFTSNMSKFAGRYVMFALLSFAIWLGVSVVMTTLGVVGVIIIAASSAAPVGILLIIVAAIGAIVVSTALNTYLTLWFPAVCVENSSISAGLKNSFKRVSGYFWPILGITLLVTICGSITGLILSGILGWIPIIGKTVSPLVSGIAQIILMVFYFEVYRNRTGRYDIPEQPQQINGQF